VWRFLAKTEEPYLKLDQPQWSLPNIVNVFRAKLFESAGTGGQSNGSVAGSAK
jgi:hypothetical protein